MTIAIFLDRDGTLNVEKGYMRNVDDVELIPGVAAAVRRINDAGFLAILVSNQTGAARGFYPESHIQALNQRVADLLKEQAGAHLDAMFYCPHLGKGVVPEFAIDCDCRKPEPGMILNACKQFPEIDLSSSYMLGDKATDVEFGYNAGVTPILLETGYGDRVLAGKYQSLEKAPELVCANMPEAIELILSRVQGPTAAR